MFMHNKRLQYSARVSEPKAVLGSTARRTMSRPNSNPTTGADLGAEPGAGRASDEDMGGAASIDDATRQAKMPMPA